MGINRTSISSVEIRDNTDTAIRVTNTKPDTGEYLDTPVQPNMLIGYYNTSTNLVELYVTSRNGYRYYKVI